MAFPGIFNDCHQKRTIAAMPAVEVEARKAAPYERIQDRAPEIFKGPPTGVKRPGERASVRTDAIRIDRQAYALIGRGFFHTAADGFNDDRIGRKRRMLRMLLGMP